MPGYPAAIVKLIWSRICLTQEESDPFLTSLPEGELNETLENVNQIKSYLHFLIQLCKSVIRSLPQRLILLGPVNQQRSRFSTSLS